MKKTLFPLGICFMIIVLAGLFFSSQYYKDFQIKTDQKTSNKEMEHLAKIRDDATRDIEMSTKTYEKAERRLVYLRELKNISFDEKEELIELEDTIISLKGDLDYHRALKAIYNDTLETLSK